jgi:cytochrome c
MFLRYTAAVGLILAAIGLPQTVLANAELARSKACLACHAVDKKLVGPAYQDVAKKYAGQADAEAKVTDSIRKGGSGKWGPVPMPGQPALTDAEVRALATWVLAGAK